MVNLQDELWSTYQQVRFVAPPKWRHKQGAIVTAFNPKSEILPLASNRLADSRLYYAIANDGYLAYPLLGTNMAFDHWEKSWLIHCSFAQAQHLAAQFSQHAFYWLEQGQLQLVRTDDGYCQSMGDIAGYWLGYPVFAPTLPMMDDW